MLPDAAAEHYRQQQRLTIATLGLVRTAWLAMNGDFDTAWESVGARILLLAMSAQLGSARAATPYVTAVLDELSINADAAGSVAPEAFVGTAGDGRPVETLLYGGVTAAKAAVQRGAAVPDALGIGGRWLDMAVHTLVADTSRDAVSVETAARPHVTGYVRMLNPPSCGRCAVLAGKWFRWNSGFFRHPRCDCRTIPATEDVAGDLRTDPRKAAAAGQITDLSEADRRAIVEDGADVGQVINARRGMYTADVFGHTIKATGTGTTLRGSAGRALAGAGLRRAPGSRYRSAQVPRLRPESIYREAKDREDAIRLLKRFGYLT